VAHFSSSCKELLFDLFASPGKDRSRAKNDYKVNLKADLQIRHLHEKIDHLLRRQYNRLFEIQQIQIELLGELGRTRES
jgi:uncharacterized membrane protein